MFKIELATAVANSQTKNVAPRSRGRSTAGGSPEPGTLKNDELCGHASITFTKAMEARCDLCRSRYVSESFSAIGTIPLPSLPVLSATLLDSRAERGDFLRCHKRELIRSLTGKERQEAHREWLRDWRARLHSGMPLRPPQRAQEGRHVSAHHREWDHSKEAQGRVAPRYLASSETSCDSRVPSPDFSSKVPGSVTATKFSPTFAPFTCFDALVEVTLKHLRLGGRA